MTRVFLSSIVLMTAFFSAGAQTSIRGKVMDSAAGTGISFAGVSLLAYYDSARVKSILADSSGGFLLTEIRAGRYFLQLSSLGYKPVLREMTIENDRQEITIDNLVMVRDPATLNEVVVVGEKAAIQYRSDKMILNVAGNSFFKTATNAFDIIRRAPGVTANPDGTLLMSGQNTPVIFVDGKPTTMSADELQAYLNGLSPEMIESIELISNPSSRYDAQYKAIIDIRLQRDKSLGWKGSLSTSFRHNKYYYSDNNLNLGLKTKRVVYTFRLGYVRGTDLHVYRALQHQANTNIMATHTPTATFNNNFNIQAGIDYSISKNQNIEIAVKSFLANRELDAFNTLTFRDSSDTKLLGINGSHNIASPRLRNNTVNIGYEARWGKSKLNVFGNITKAVSKRDEDIQNRDRITNELISYWETALRNEVLVRNIQADLTRTMQNSTLEAGAKFAFTTTDNNLRYDTLNKDNVFVPDAGRTNQFVYDEYVGAGYLSYEHRFEKVTVKLNMRAEHTRTVADAITQHEIVKRSYTTWLPGAGVYYTIDANQRLNFSFTRRITRPNFDQLNPFRFYLSPLNFWVGNPYLRPSVTSVFNLAYTNRSFNVSVNVGREVDYLTRYPEYNRVTNELQYLGTNLPYNSFANIEAGYSFAIKNWWKISHNGGVYYNKQQMPYLGKVYAIGVVDYSINGNQVFALPKGFTLDLSYRYRSRSGNSLYIIHSTWTADMGLQKSWLQGSLNTKLNFYDMFDTFTTSLVFREKEIIDNRLSHRFGTQRGVLAITYNFGKSVHKAKQVKSSEEEGRISN
ncbi:MAG: outer membrane beta-barrel family protein [Chitinophagaceae bacterium]